MPYKIPIGVEFYKQMIENSYYYVDKTLLIKDILKQGSIVTLFTRPRRFGKTLAQSMLKTFFEKEILSDGTTADNSIYFQNKNIMKTEEEYTRHMGQYPVIFLSLKSAKQPTYEMAYESLADEIRKEYDRHSYLLKDTSITERTKKRYNSVLNMEADKITLAKSIAFLSELLEKYHNQKVIILLDEYENSIREWMRQRIKTVDFSELYSAILDGNAEVFENILKKLLRESISFMDSAENFYHGFLLGLLGDMQNYNKFSNRESGEGRYDIILKPDDEKQPVIILELKRVLRFTEMENMCYKALQQIENKHYDECLLDEGYTFIKKYGICFCRKSCMIRIQE